MTDAVPSLLDNPGRAKLALVSFGAALPDGLADASRWLSQVNSVETVVDLRLPSGHFATVPVGQPYTERSPVALRLLDANGAAELCADGRRLEVKLQPAPDFYRARTRGGARMGSFSSLHERLLQLTPLMGCGFFVERDAACRYCLYDSLLNAEEPPLRDPLELVEVVRAALAERDVDTVYLYNAYAPGEDAGLARLVPLIALLRRHLGHRQIALETVAPPDPAVIDELYAAGLDIFVCNLELFDSDHFARLCPGKAAHGGQAAIWRALEKARTVFRGGAVVSNLIVGLEPPEATQAGTEALVERGVVPLLQPFRPLAGTPLESEAPPRLEALEEAFLHLYDLLSRSQIPAHRLRHMGRVLTPMESRALVGGEVSLADRLAISPLGRRVGGWMDHLRRNLRVRHTGADGGKG